MSRLNPLIEQYLAGVKELKAAVAGMSREQALARPIAGKWSTLEVVCHIADFEPIFADRIKRVIAENNPTIFGADENDFARALAYHDRDLQEELTIIEATRSQLARILRRQPDSVLERTGNHSGSGPRTVEQYLSSAIRHIPHHAKFILEKRQALGLK